MADVIAFFFAGRLSCTRRMLPDFSVIMSLILYLLWQFERNLYNSRYRLSFCFRDGAARAQGLDIGRTKPKLLENLFVVFSKSWGPRGGHFVDAMHLNGT